MPIETYFYYMTCLQSIVKMKSIALLAVFKEYRSVTNDLVAATYPSPNKTDSVA